MIQPHIDLKILGVGLLWFFHTPRVHVPKSKVSGWQMSAKYRKLTPPRHSLKNKSTVRQGSRQHLPLFLRGAGTLQCIRLALLQLCQVLGE